MNAAAENQVFSLAQILLRLSSGWVSIVAICCGHRDKSSSKEQSFRYLGKKNRPLFLPHKLHKYGIPFHRLPHWYHGKNDTPLFHSQHIPGRNLRKNLHQFGIRQFASSFPIGLCLYSWTFGPGNQMFLCLPSVALLLIPLLRNLALRPNRFRIHLHLRNQRPRVLRCQKAVRRFSLQTLAFSTSLVHIHLPWDIQIQIPPQKMNRISKPLLSDACSIADDDLTSSIP
jgi:hypothetical protein